MGRKIVTQKSPNDIGRRSRLWSIEDIDHVLRDKMGTRFNQSIVLEPSPELYEVYSDPEAFLNMCNLKLLMISDVHLLSGLVCLPNSLKVLAWDGYPLEALPLGKRVELVDLKMHHSKIIQPWNETQFFRKLKSIDLCHSKDLTQTPIVSGTPHLEQLILEDCTSLVEVHQSVGQHKKLTILNMKNCINLKIFPSKLEMGSLKDLILCGCSKVVKLPEFGENMKSLVMLNLKDCENLLCLPSTIRNLKSLEILNISGCSKFSRLANNVDEDQPLEELVLSGTAVRDVNSFNPIPMDMIFTTISHLPLLKELDLSFCYLSDGSISFDLSCLSSLGRLSLSGNNFSLLPDNFVANHSKLRFLDLNYCKSLLKLPIVPQHLRQLNAQACSSLEPAFDPLKLWNFLASDDNEIKSLAQVHVVVTGSEIPPWFESQNYVSLNNEDSIISIRVDIPLHCIISEWWRIDLCLGLQFVSYNPLERPPCFVYWSVSSTEPGFPSRGDYACIHIDLFHPPILFILSLGGLQEQLQGDSNQLEVRISTRALLSIGRLTIRECGSHVYCKDDVEPWHSAKHSQLQISEDHIWDNEKENIESIEKIPSTSGNSSSRNAMRICQPIHPTTDNQNLQKFPIKSEDVINPSSSMPNSSMSESSDPRPVRFHNKTCLCEQRAALKEVDDRFDIDSKI
ncbi:hypothetical protein L6164_031469 [Bauhinia variegata]|uniref:Uncharacterized protein n=1 Tax=Bauhinia variegata TaxID=167791 RepID=A0ACB9LF34_BAUVA|nr:hypothetical protein L6164_031469 [Bauhinia variegata]